MGKIAAHSAYDMFSFYKDLIVNYVFSYLDFLVGTSFLLRYFLIVAYLYLSTSHESIYILDIHVCLLFGP